MQHGCLTSAELAAAGVDRREIARQLADGRLRRRHRGVYALGPVESPLAPYAAALLAVGPFAVLSHQVAAALYQLLPAPDEIDVTTTVRGARRRQGIRIHTTTTLPQRAVLLHHHLRITSPERTLHDLAKQRHPEHRLVVEADGFAFHSSRAAIERDRARDADLTARGYRTIRVTWRQLRREPHAVVATLAAALALAAA